MSDDKSKVSAGTENVTDPPETGEQPNTQTNTDELAALKQQLAEASATIEQLKPLADSGKKAIEQKIKAREKAQEFEGLYNELKPQYEQITQVNGELQAKYDALQAEIRADLMSQVPDDLQEDLKDADLQTIRIAIKAAGTNKPQSKPGGVAKPSPAGGEKPYWEFTEIETSEYIRVNGQKAWTDKVTNDLRNKKGK